MLLIGFVWCLIGVAACIVSRSFVPGRWEDSGPVAMMVASAGAFIGGTGTVILMEGPNGYGPPAVAGTMPGIVASIVGAVVAFGIYAADAKRSAAAA
ncbi:MAG TPA: hypothetical protein VHR66_01955 [Gemmataceae bacterium]|jgi:uncharacterized membrane protein YeaQ/YmgE (transglycosylase-associated protein family)|nr:hypothetical protein [Gemmataceae bacterium]